MGIMRVNKQEFWAFPENNYSLELFLKKRHFTESAFMQFNFKPISLAEN